MQLISKIEEHPDDKLNAHVFVGGVAGLGLSNEAIIMRSDEDLFWAATLIYDEPNDEIKVNYHTNDSAFKKRLPKTIEAWREGFKDYKIIF